MPALFISENAITLFIYARFVNKLLIFLQIDIFLSFLWKICFRYVIIWVADYARGYFFT